MDSADPPFVDTPVLSDDTSTPAPVVLPPNPGLKRRASPPPDDLTTEGSRKRFKEDTSDKIYSSVLPRDSRFLEELEEELQCGCCSALVYKPVLVLSCQHFFCGSCCALWIRNGGHNCPSCRAVSTIVTPFRALQGTIDAFLRAAPHKARTERERQQADELYSGGTLRLPIPRDQSPEPNITQNTDFVQPCPHCTPGNPYGWVCPQPIPDPNLDPDHAWPVDDGLPPGHGHCGNCEVLLALRAPPTTKCDMCLVSFCGINVQGRCKALPLLAQEPHGLADIADLIESTYVYDCFDGNTVEAEYVLDYLTTQGLSPTHIYREIVTLIQSQPGKFQPLIDANIFSDIHPVTPETERNPDSPRTRICRLCAAEVFFWGLKDWWIRERLKGFVDPAITGRPDCRDGSACVHQKDLGHTREFNHIIASKPSGSTQDVPQQQPSANIPGSSAGSTIPITPAVETQPFVVDVQEDLLVSSPTTPDFRDAIDAF